MIELNPYERLAVAIINQAAEDYHSAQLLVRWAKRGGTKYNQAQCELYLIENFFCSDWCGALTFGHGEKILRCVKKGEL